MKHTVLLASLMMFGASLPNRSGWSPPRSPHHVTEKPTEAELRAATRIAIHGLRGHVLELRLWHDALYFDDGHRLGVSDKTKRAIVALSESYARMAPHLAVAKAHWRALGLGDPDDPNYVRPSGLMRPNPGTSLRQGAERVELAAAVAAIREDGDALDGTVFDGGTALGAGEKLKCGAGESLIPDPDCCSWEWGDYNYDFDASQSWGDEAVYTLALFYVTCGPLTNPTPAQTEWCNLTEADAYHYVDMANEYEGRAGADWDDLVGMTSFGMSASSETRVD